MALKINLANGQRAQRKLLITIAEWDDASVTDSPHTGKAREILGARTPDSSIEFNVDSETSTDILGISYTDVNKTEPQQTFDPYYIMGGSKLGEYMTMASLRNDIDAYNGKFTVYIIAAFIQDDDTQAYYCVRHEGCTIIPQQIGGESFNSLPIELHYSNNITEGTVDKLADDFTFNELTTSNLINIAAGMSTPVTSTSAKTTAKKSGIDM